MTKSHSSQDPLGQAGELGLGFVPHSSHLPQAYESRIVTGVERLLLGSKATALGKESTEAVSGPPTPHHTLLSTLYGSPLPKTVGLNPSCDENHLGSFKNKQTNPKAQATPQTK